MSATSLPTSLSTSPPASSPASTSTNPSSTLLGATVSLPDWTKEDIPEDKDGYDIVLALSITKWIHLNQGDDGLVAFFRKIHTVLHKHGHLILEPQPWESYAKARRMSEHLRATYQTLQLRPSNFSTTLNDIGFELVKTLGETGEGGFRRSIDLYVKR
ncbi:hypothetical protein Agabi119p4_9692 [Agaricus bisporus var. burnettii]|uniref:RNA methyltransferase n=1 Tax=Agaricus bisporus var. burnettii TaxID=192524 RepID=A0A8H7C489_AGABI|nr:hypothetical protein Agabi119p4_9692 [Agaricus bisporus var. burnettii]